MSTRDAVVRIIGDDRLLAAVLGRSQASIIGWGRSLGIRVQEVIRGSLRTVGDITGFTGLGSLTEAIRSAKAYSDQLLILRQQASLSSAQIMELRGEIDRVAVATGASQSDVLGGVTKFHEITGNIELARSSMEALATVSKATATPMNDIAAAMAAMFQNFDISTHADMIKAWDVLVSQASAGKVEVRDMAAEFAQLGGALDQFNMKGVQGVASADALLQVVARIRPNASEAATALRYYSSAVYSHSRELKAAGVDIFSTELGGDPEKGLAGDLFKITRRMNEVFNAKKGTRAQFGDVLGNRMQAGQVFDVLNKFPTLYKVMMQTGDMAGATMKRFNDRVKDAAFGWDQFAVSAQKAINDIFLDKLKAIASVLQAIGKVIGFLAANPLTGLLPALIAYKAMPVVAGLAAPGFVNALLPGASKGGSALDSTIGVQRVFVVGAAPGVFGVGTGGGGGMAGLGPMAPGGGKPGLVQQAGGALGLVSNVLSVLTIGGALGSLIAADMGYYDYSQAQNQAAFYSKGALAPDTFRQSIGEKFDRIDRPSSWVGGRPSRIPVMAGEQWPGGGAEFAIQPALETGNKLSALIDVMNKLGEEARLMVKRRAAEPEFAQIMIGLLRETLAMIKPAAGGKGGGPTRGGSARDNIPEGLGG